MAKLPNIRRLIVEDYPQTVRSWIGPKLLQPLNSFMESIYAALNRGLTLNENFAAEVRSVDLDGTFPLRLAWTLPQRPRAVLVGNCVRKDGVVESLTDAVGIRWSFNQQGQLQVDQVVGVTPSASDRYVLELVIFTG